jgi:hypothetical protein
LKGCLFLFLLFAGLGVISHFTGSETTYVNRVGELEMPSMFGSWLMIGYVALLVVIFRSNSTFTNRNDNDTSQNRDVKNDDWPTYDESDPSRDYPDYYDPENKVKP